MFSSPGEKANCIVNTRYVYILQSIHHIIHRSLFLSLSSKSNHRARGIDQITHSHRITFLILQSTHLINRKSLSLSLFYKKSNHRARYRSNYTPLSTARFSNPCSFEFSPSSPHLPRILSTTPRISRRNLWLILSRFPRRR